MLHLVNIGPQLPPQALMLILLPPPTDVFDCSKRDTGSTLYSSAGLAVAESPATVCPACEVIFLQIFLGFLGHVLHSAAYHGESRYCVTL